MNVPINASAASPNLSALLGAAQTDGNLTGGGLAALNLTDLGATMQAGLGFSVDDVSSSDAILLLLVLDDSGSISYTPGNEQAVRDGVNGILDALADTKQAPSIYVYCIQLNRGILHPFKPLVDGKTGKLDASLKLTAANYCASGGTPLFRTATAALGTAVAKVQEFANAGVPARAITVIITDGADTDGKHARTVEPVVKDLLRSEVHLVIGMGIDDGSTDFVEVFTDMGIQAGGRKHKRDQPQAGLPDWVLTPKNDPSSIRRACAMVSQSAVRASQAAAGGGNFSQITAGGFGSP
jgi:hypothetical protein